MAKTLFCQLCGKSPVIGFNRPKSQHKTKKIVYPNVQKWRGVYACGACRRTIKKFSPKPVVAESQS